MAFIKAVSPAMKKATRFLFFLFEGGFSYDRDKNLA